MALPKAKNRNRKSKSSQRKRPRLRRAEYFLVLALIGGILTLFSNGYITYHNWRYSFAITPPIHQIAHTDDIPLMIKMPQIGISLPVDVGDIQNGVWQVSNYNATFLARSGTPGEKSNTVIYGHNLDAIFGKLRFARVGHTILVTTKNGTLYRYIITSIQTVSPDRVDLVLPTKNPLLTIYTCTGFLDSQRLVIQATPDTGS